MGLLELECSQTQPPLCPWGQESRGLKSGTHAPRWMRWKAWEEVPGGSPRPCDASQFREEIKTGNWATTRVSHKEGDSKQEEAHSCRTMGAERAIFVWLQQLIEPGGTDSVPGLLSIFSSKSGKFPCQKILISFLLRDD